MSNNEGNFKLFAVTYLKHCHDAQIVSIAPTTMLQSPSLVAMDLTRKQKVSTFQIDSQNRTANLESLADGADRTKLFCVVSENIYRNDI